MFCEYFTIIKKPIILVHANKDFYTRPRVLLSILNDIV